MAEPVLLIMDQDCSSYVRSWGTLQVIRKLKLSDNSLFASTFNLELDNSTGAFTPGGPASLFPKVGWAGKPASITRNGKELYSGFIRELAVDAENDSVNVELTTSMTEAADVVADLTGTDLNPAMACLTLLEQAGIAEDRIHRPSFSVAAGYFGSNGIDVACAPDQGQTCLSLASKIADVCSMDFIMRQGRVYCLVSKPWAGEGLRQTITGDNTRELGPLTSDSASFANRVEFSYGASLTVTLDDEASQRVEGRVVSTAVDATTDALVQVTTAAAARFFGGLLLSRTSPRRNVLKATLGPDFDEVLPGERYPVTYSPLGLDASPFEVNEAQMNLDLDEIQATLQSLEVTA